MNRVTVPAMFILCAVTAPAQGEATDRAAVLEWM
jgi:hypothetical protein